MAHGAWHIVLVLSAQCSVIVHRTRYTEHGGRVASVVNPPSDKRLAKSDYFSNNASANSCGSKSRISLIFSPTPIILMGIFCS